MSIYSSFVLELSSVSGCTFYFYLSKSELILIVFSKIQIKFKNRIDLINLSSMNYRHFDDNFHFFFIKIAFFLRVNSLNYFIFGFFYTFSFFYSFFRLFELLKFYIGYFLLLKVLSFLYNSLYFLL